MEQPALLGKKSHCSRADKRDGSNWSHRPLELTRPVYSPSFIHSSLAIVSHLRLDSRCGFGGARFPGVFGRSERGHFAGIGGVETRAKNLIHLRIEGKLAIDARGIDQEERALEILPFISRWPSCFRRRCTGSVGTECPRGWLIIWRWEDCCLHPAPGQGRRWTIAAPR